ncbi:GGDEF domain-containing protein [Paenibacillus tarimensis]
MMKHMDSLTELPNRKQLELNLNELLRGDEHVALALIDVDHFMEINALGDEKGDEVLKTLASVFEEEAPNHAFRVSGDEFALLLPGHSLEQAFLKMELIRKKVQDSQGLFNLTSERELTITVGVAQYPRDAKDGQTLNRAAGAALMAAKEAGRNHVALPPNEEMVMKSCYYSSTSLRKLKALAEQLNKKESVLLREALDDILRKYDNKKMT